MKSKKIAMISSGCVACGVCVSECPLKAINIPKGVTSIVDSDKCVGCSKCSKSCPGDFIYMIERNNSDEK